MEISGRIKFLRARSGMTLEEVGKRISVSKQTLYKYENNIITNIPYDKIVALSKIFSCTPAYLVGWENPEPITENSNSTGIQNCIAPDTDMRSNRLLGITNLMTDEELLCYMNILLFMPEDKRKRVYGYIDCLKEQ